MGKVKDDMDARDRISGCRILVEIILHDYTDGCYPARKEYAKDQGMEDDLESGFSGRT